MSARNTLVEHLLDVAWAQWTLLGVRGVRVARSDLAIGLEELILLTCVLADDDPRLRDEALDWCRHFGHFVSKPRIKSLLKSWNPSPTKAFQPFSDVLGRSSTGGWGSESIVSSGKSRAPDLRIPALIGLRLRAIFGVGSRADLLCALLAWPSPAFTAPELVYTGYSRPSIAETLESLDQGGLLRSSFVGNRRVFSWRNRAGLVALVGSLPSAFPNYAVSFRVFHTLLALHSRVEGKSARVASVEAAKVLKSIARDLEELDMVPPDGGEPVEAWRAFEAWLAHEAERLRQG